MRSLSLLAFLLFGAGVSGASFEDDIESAIFQQASSKTAMDELHRNLQMIEIDFTPDADPQLICDAFQEASQRGTTQYQCTCDIADDRSIDLACIQTPETKTCNEDSSLCLVTTINLELDLNNDIEVVETCTEYIDVNTAVFEGSGKKVANYTDIRPCIRVLPQTPGDFSRLQSCTATVNQQACDKCEICDVDSIKLDCSNTNPNQEPLCTKCTRAPSGTLTPFFEQYQEGEQGCPSAGTTWLQDIQLVLLFALAIAVPVSYFL